MSDTILLNSQPLPKTPAQEAAAAYLNRRTEKQKADPTLLDDKSYLNAYTLDEFMNYTTHDPNELIKDRFLCKGGGMLLVGPTGVGKSSLSMQLAIRLGLGQTEFGLRPVRPLKSLIIQAENDKGDIGEMVRGVFNGLTLSSSDQATACENVKVVTADQFTSLGFFTEVVEPNLKEHLPNIVWIDPVLSYLGGDASDQKVVGPWLRNYLNPLIHKYNCAAVLIHHTNKISNSPDKPVTDPAYLGTGSAEWANWARAILAVRKTDVPNLFELVAGKRGGKLKWKTADGENLAFSKYIGYCKRPDTICWIEMAVGEAEELRAGGGKCADDVLKHVPQTDLISKELLVKLCRQTGMGRNLTAELIAGLLEEEELVEVPVPRSGKRPKVLFSRKPVSLAKQVMLDGLTRNSQGHYILPARPESEERSLTE